jgi:hypothetical protein
MPHGIRGWGAFIIAQAVLSFIWYWLKELAAHAMLTWSDEQIAHFLHLSSPEAPTVISWAIPISLGFVTLLAYHAYHSSIAPVAASVNAVSYVAIPSWR